MRSRASALLPAAAWLVVAFGWAGPAAAEEPGAASPEAPRILFSLSATLTRPADTALRDLYGGRQTAFGVECEVRVRTLLNVFAGARVSSAKGTTAIVAAGNFQESYPIELTNRSVRVGVALTQAGRARLRWTAGVGFAVGSYEERWPALGEPSNGSSLGMVALAGAHYALASRLGLVARGEWSALTARDRAADGRKPNLGGVGLSLGASVAF